MALKTRVLSFIVEGQSIRKDPNCDFTGLVSGTKGYYQAKFSFDKEWKDYKCIAIFKTSKITKFVPIINNACSIPDEITEHLNYRISVLGQSGLQSIPTTEVSIRQNKGGSNG